MKKSEIDNRIKAISQRRKDAKYILSALVPWWQKKHLMVFLISYILSNLFLLTKGYSQSDSLLKYLEIATKNNPVVLQKFTEYQVALQKIPQVGSLSDPELSLGVFLKPMELISGNQVADIRLMQMFPWFGVLRYARDEMSLMANAKFEIFRDSKLQLIYDVQRTWYELYKIQQNILVSEKNIEILKTIENLSLVKFKSGSSVSNTSTSSTPSTPSTSVMSSSPTGTTTMQSMGGSTGTANNQGTIQAPPLMNYNSMGSQVGFGLTDIYSIQMEMGELENNIAFLKDKERTVKAFFNSYLNRPPLSTLATTEIIPYDSLKLSLLSVSDSIFANNPMLSMLEFEKQSFEARTNMVKAMGYPMVGLGLNYSLVNRNEMSTSSMNGSDMIMPMVTVTLPIYRKKYNAMKNEAELLKTGVSQNYQAVVNTLNTEYYKALQQYQDSQRRVKLYKNQYLLASRTLDLLIISYSTSSSDLSDILRVRQQSLDYELKQVEAIADFNTAVALLVRLGNIDTGGNKLK